MVDWAKKLGFDEDEPKESEQTAQGAPSNPIPAPDKYATSEAAFETAAIIELCRNSLDFLAGFLLPTVFKYFFPDIYKQAWSWLISYVHKERDFSQLALGLPRGFAKTTFIKIFVFYVIAFTKRQFILICGHDITKAAAIVYDVCNFLDSINVKKVFGDWKLGIDLEQQKLKVFGFRGRNVVIAAGTVASVRGINYNNIRPDIMIFDDIQSLEDAQSEVISKQIETDMYATAMKSKNPEGCLYIFIGNMYPTKWSILRKIKKNPTWFKFIVGAITSDGKSIWEELQPLAQLLREYQNDCSAGRPDIFFAEVLNDEEATVNNLIDVSKIPMDPYKEETIHNGNFIIIDPATDKANADAVSIGYFEVFDGKPVSKEILDGRFSPGDMIRHALDMGLRHSCRVIAVEATAYQYSALYWFNFVINLLGLQTAGFYCVEVYSGTRSKTSRILEMFKRLLAGEQYLGDDTRSQTKDQIIPFNPLKTNNTDGILDLHTYAPKVIELYGDLISSTLVIDSQDFAAIPVPSEFENCPF